MRATLALALAALAIAATPAAASSALEPYLGTAGLTTAQSGLDFGDAPDGRPARYAGKPRVRGKFPSRARSGGPRHSSPGPSIGGWTGEADSRQVDRDRDDGAQVKPRSCRLSTLTIPVDASKADPARTLHVSAWFDWNQDGDWADGGTRRCGPEWGIQNLVLDPASLGPDRIALVTLRFRAGRVPKQFWWRVQVHAGDPVPHLGGGGQDAATSGGETEDWFFDRVRRSRIRLTCTPALGIIQHGRSHRIHFRMEGDEAEELRITDVNEELVGPADGLGHLSVIAPGFPGSYDVLSLEEHERAPPSQLVAFELTIEGTLNRQPRTFKARCHVGVTHAERITPPPQPPAVVIRAPAANVVVNPDRPDPAAAACGAGFALTPAGQPGGSVIVSCAGVDFKSYSIGVGDRRFTDITSDGDCTTLTEPRQPTTQEPNPPPRVLALRCIFAPPNRGRDLQTSFLTDNPFVRMRLHVLAGGRTSRIGTAIVLLQDWFVSRDGVRCSQTVPRTEQQQCTPP